LVTSASIRLRTQPSGAGSPKKDAGAGDAAAGGAGVPRQSGGPQDSILLGRRTSSPDVRSCGGGTPEAIHEVARRAQSARGSSWRWCVTSDELDDYQAGAERAEAREDEHERELALADAAQLADVGAEQDETCFDETRRAYSGVEEGDGGVEEGDGGVDVQELEEAGAQLNDPEREAHRGRISRPR
jgi:hypothetical protein